MNMMYLYIKYIYLLMSALLEGPVKSTPHAGLQRVCDLIPEVGWPVGTEVLRLVSEIFQRSKPEIIIIIIIKI